MMRSGPAPLWLTVLLAGVVLLCPLAASSRESTPVKAGSSDQVIAQAAPAPALMTPASTANEARPFADWAALVVAGDWRAGPTKTTQAFDNGRRDIAQALGEIGFSPANIVQFSLRPSWPGDRKGEVVSAETALMALAAKGTTAPAGCLLYLTSHGGPDGATFGPDVLMTPKSLRIVMDTACPDRPSVVVVSACYSGVFVPKLKAPDRLVLTAARKDRASFGCGAADEHTYFDECVLLSLPSADNFLALGPAVQACVKGKERATGARPASSPQVSMGEAFAADAGARRFLHPSG